MPDKQYRIALISATPTAIEPATDGLGAEFPEAQVWNILDDRLMVDATDRGGVTPALADRMRRLIAHALSGDADGILLTCSLYGAIAQQTDAPVPVYAPDGAAFDMAGSGAYRTVAVVASFESAMTDAVVRFTDFVADRGNNVVVRGVVAPDALAATRVGDPSALVDALAAACVAETVGVDVILLAQYSLAPARAELEKRLGLPVVSGPSSAAAALRSAIVDNPPTGTLGAIADDYTGGTDVALAFQRAGLRTLLFFTTPPSDGRRLPPHDAVVIALKSRTTASEDAVAASLAACAWLREMGTDQVYFKYCSTFDSTPEGNIGPVLDALSEQLASGAVISTPSSPAHGRTVYQGNLFVNGTLLAESPMAHHPLTPMMDSYLPRVLAKQAAHGVGSLSLEQVRRGSGALRAVVAEEDARSRRFHIADAVDDSDLRILAQAARSDVLVAGAVGLGSALAELRAGVRDDTDSPAAGGDPVGEVPSAVLAGSSSARTLEQVDAFRHSGYPCYQLRPGDASTPDALAADALDWVDANAAGTTPLVYSSMPPDDLARVQQRLGTTASSEMVEGALALIARGLVERGVRRLVLAGGESSGAVVDALGLTGGVIGPDVAEGVPWIYTIGEPRMAMLLKSGNFGDMSLFSRAIDPDHHWGTNHYAD